MANVEEVLHVFQSFNLHTIDNKWVEDFVKNEFLEPPSCPDGLEAFLIESDYLKDSLRSLRKLLSSLIPNNAGQNETDNVWSIILGDGHPRDNILSLLQYIIICGQQNSASITEMEAGLAAASVYLHLLACPGSGAFQIFRFMIYLKCMDFLGKWARDDVIDKKKKASKTQTEPQHDEDSDQEVEEHIAEKKSLDNARMVLLRDLVQLLPNLNVTSSEETLELTITTLANLSKLDPERCSHEAIVERPIKMLKSPSHLAYKGFTSLVVGDISVIILKIFDRLMPNILMIVGDEVYQATDSISSHQAIRNENAINFLCWLIDQHGDDISKIIRSIIKYIFNNAPSKGDYPNRLAKTIQLLLKRFKLEAFANTLKWLRQKVRNPAANQRKFALEVFATLVEEEERDKENVLPTKLHFVTTHAAMIDLFLRRMNDIAAPVRTRALLAISACCNSKYETVLQVLRNFLNHERCSSLVTPNSVATTNQNSATRSHTPSLTSLPFETIEGGSATRSLTFGLITLPVENNSEARKFKYIIKERTKEQKMAVRKAAIQALQAVIILGGDGVEEKDLDVFVECTRDTLLSIRKQCLVSLTTILQSLPDNTRVQRAWLEGVLPGVMDHEDSVQQKSLELLHQVILSNITVHQRSNGSHHHLAWKLLSSIAEIKGKEMLRYLQEACFLWSRDGKLQPSLLTFIQSHVDTEYNQAAWMFLSELLNFNNKVKPDFVLSYWRENIINPSGLDILTMQRVLDCISAVIPLLSREEMLLLADELEQTLLSFKYKPGIISSVFTILSRLRSTDQVTDKISNIYKELIQACDSYLVKFLENTKQDSLVNEEEVHRRIYTLGEICMYCPKLASSRHMKMLVSCIAGPRLAEASQSQDVLPGTQAILDTQTPLSQFPAGLKMSPSIRAFGVIALGKLCLVHSGHAKKCIPALVHELNNTNDPNLKINIVTVVADLSRRYTSVTDPYVPNITARLFDRDLSVRKQTMLLLTSLIQEDFLKWKGAMYFRFLPTLVDIEMESFSKMCLLHLMKRTENMIFQHFIETLFYFNQYKDHPTYSKFVEFEDNQGQLSLKGKENKKKRMDIYKFFLENMSAVQLFKLSFKIPQDILNAVVDNIIPLNADTHDLIEDALDVLASKEMKVKKHCETAEPSLKEDKRNQIITKAVEKNDIENVMPSVLSLRQVLQAANSTLIKPLMYYISQLMKDYKAEVRDAMLTDLTLRREIEFDIKKMEEEEKQNKAGGRTPGIQRTPGRKTPGPRTPGRRTPAPHTPNPRTQGVRPALIRTPQPRDATQNDAEIATGSPKLNALPTTPKNPRQPSSMTYSPYIAGILTPRNNNQSMEARASLSISARKALKRKTKKVAWLDESLRESEKTPQRRQHNLRAISTPSGRQSFIDVTFQADESAVLMEDSTEQNDI